MNISAEVFTEAFALAKKNSLNVYAQLERQLGGTEVEIISAVAHLLEIDFLSMNDLYSMQIDFSKWGFVQSSQYKALVFLDGDKYIAVVADPLDQQLRDRLESAVRGCIKWAVGLKADIDAFLRIQEEKAENVNLAKSVNIESDVVIEEKRELSIVSIAEDSSPIIRLVNSTIYDAMKAGASDIHFENLGSGLAIKFRIDGVLSLMNSVVGAVQADHAISRIKVMAELDIGERRIPQDGRFRLAIKNRDIDFRVSIMPSLFGEDAVIRILDKQALTDQFRTLRLDLLGFADDVLYKFRKLCSEPYGMVLVTGPTGSGKTTTLYAAISEIQTGEDKIVTIEDPVEYHLPGTLQIPVNEKKGLNFATGLRSILRHDPDKILLGEIRDAETAQIAIQSALTGHLVFTSVHANNVFDVLGRFIHMGIDPYGFVSCLNGVLAQRLIRVVCRNCAEPISLDLEKRRVSNIDTETLNKIQFVRGRGCGECRGTGYKGRVAIGEVLMLNDEIRELIVARSPISVLKAAAKNHGTRFLRESAVDLLLSEKTTLDEINRVTFAD